MIKLQSLVSDIAVLVLKMDVKLQLTNRHCFPPPSSRHLGNDEDKEGELSELFCACYA